MRTETTTRTLYRYDELTEDGKRAAIEGLADINVDHDWWDCLYEDAKTVGIKLTSFDLDRSRGATGNFIEGAEDTANLVIDNHGEPCETYKTSQGYISDRAELVKKYSDGKAINIVSEDNEYDFDAECDELDAEYLKSIIEDYSILLQKEYEYLTSDDAIVETIEANEYEFTEDGELA